MNQQTQEEAAYVADARARLQAEAAARREYDPQEAARVRSLMWDADQRIKMPRIAAEPTEIRRWAGERSARFGPVKPAERIERHMHTEALSVALSGRTPPAEQVALLAAPTAGVLGMLIAGLVVRGLGRFAGVRDFIGMLGLAVPGRDVWRGRW